MPWNKITDCNNYGSNGRAGNANFSEKSTLCTHTGVDQNFQTDLGAMGAGPYEFQGKSVWTNPLVLWFTGNLHGPIITNALKVHQRFPPKTGIDPWMALLSNLVDPMGWPEPGSLNRGLGRTRHGVHGIFFSPEPPRNCQEKSTPIGIRPDKGSTVQWKWSPPSNGNDPRPPLLV